MNKRAVAASVVSFFVGTCTGAALASGGRSTGQRAAPTEPANPNAGVPVAQPTAPAAPPVAQPAQPTAAPAPQATVVLVGEPTLTRSSGFVRAEGRLRNDTAQTRSYVLVDVTLFNAQGGVLSVINASASNVTAGAEASYQGIGAQNVEQWARVEARISTIL